MTMANAQIFLNLDYADDYDVEDFMVMMMVVLNDSVWGDNETKFYKDITYSHKVSEEQETNVCTTISTAGI